MKKKAMSKEKAARALARLAEEHLKSYPLEERERMIKAFGMKIFELKRKRSLGGLKKNVSVEVCGGPVQKNCIDCLGRALALRSYRRDTSIA